MEHFSFYSLLIYFSSAYDQMYVLASFNFYGSYNPCSEQEENIKTRIVFGNSQIKDKSILHLPVNFLTWDFGGKEI